MEEELDIDMATGFSERWFNKPLWVLNPGGKAVLQESDRSLRRETAAWLLSLARRPTVYLTSACGSRVRTTARPGQAHEQESGSHQDCVPVDSRRRQLGVPGAASNADSAGAPAFAERRLHHFPDQRELFDSYLGRTLPQQAKRVEEFLKSGWTAGPSSFRGTGPTRRLPT